MSATLLSAFYDLDFLHKTEKSLAGLSLGGVLDTRAVGAPLACAPGCPRRSPGRPPEPASRERVPPPARPAPASARYKTELCRPFEERGACKYGDKCQFAHGPHELRSLVRHPKYKTELCRTYHSSGLCPYGPRCHFIHNADERRPGPRLHHSLSFPGFAAPTPPPRAPGARHSPPDSPQPGRDRHRSGSLSPGSRSGSYSPGPDPGRRLPIFSRLSVSDD